MTRHKPGSSFLRKSIPYFLKDSDGLEEKSVAASRLPHTFLINCKNTVNPLLLNLYI